jgi:RNA polymerase sigma-70 factor (ECF subfamily)
MSQNPGRASAAGRPDEQDRQRRRAEEAELVRRLVRLRTGQTGETGSLYLAKNELFGRFGAPIARYCARIVGDAIRGEELAQDVIETAWRKLETYDSDRASFRAWLYGIARFKADHARTKKRDVLVADGIFEPEAPEQAMWKQLHRDERRRMVLAAIRDLPTLEQDALYRRYFEEMPVKRITEELGIEGPAGARGVLQSSRRHFEQAIRRHMNERRIRSSFMVTGMPSHG